MESGRVRWREIDTEGQILGKVSGEMEQQHPVKDILEIEMDQGLGVNLAEEVSVETLGVNQEEMETDLDLKLHQDTKVS